MSTAIAVYDGFRDVALPHAGVQVEYAGPVDIDRIADDVVACVRIDPDFAAQIASQLRTEGQQLY